MQEKQQAPAKMFTDLALSVYRIRYMIAVVALADDTNCEQLENDTLCLAETTRACCLCGTPTCSEHEQHPINQACIIHAGQPGPGGGLCCVCIICQQLPREVQEQIYHFRRQLNEEEYGDD